MPKVEAKKKIWIIVGVVLFAGYFFSAARPIPLETVLVPRWLNLVESDAPLFLSGKAEENASPEGIDSGDLPVQQKIPFSLGDRFGYVSRDGLFSVNQEKRANVWLSQERWAEYEAEPDRIAVRDNSGETVAVIENPRGYPFFFGENIFIINKEQNAISAIDTSGAVSWDYDFSSILTCVDSAGGMVLAGSLNGTAWLLDAQGSQVFSFDPGGSRISIILGCAISRDASRIALVSGEDEQRFLVLERFGISPGDYKVVYHEFLGRGFNRLVYVSFVENDQWVVFERSGGLGFYEVSSRQTGRAALKGELSAIDYSGGQGILFAVVSRSPGVKDLVGIKLPGRIIIESPFRGDEAFLGRMDSMLIAGSSHAGGRILASFDLEKR
jgi:hypothetical protein